MVMKYWQFLLLLLKKTVATQYIHYTGLCRLCSRKKTVSVASEFSGQRLVHTRNTYLGHGVGHIMTSVFNRVELMVATEKVKTSIYQTTRSSIVKMIT